MNTTRTASEADNLTLAEDIKAIVLPIITPEELAEHLLLATGEDDLAEAVASALTDLMDAANRMQAERVLNGRAEADLSDAEREKLLDAASPVPIICELVENYGVKAVVELARTAAAGQAGEPLPEANETDGD